MSLRPLGVPLLVALLVPWGCGPADADGSGDDDTAPPTCLGTVYPGVATIDPDHPVYSDAIYTQEEVTAMFAEAREADDDAYRAYLFARDHGALLECAYCDCGCGGSSGHLGNLDCYKDLHGFT